MTEKVGGIQYTVDADTAAMLKAEAVVNKSIKNQVAAFDKADQAVRDFMRSQKDMGNTVNKMGQVIDRNGDIVVEATNKYRAMATTAQNSFSNLNTQVTKSAEGVKKGVHRNFGQAGIQVQQFVGQLQGGQSAMLALSQQSADLGIVLGAPMVGVIISLASVFAGMLIPSLMSSNSSMEKLEKSVEKVKAVMTLGAGGVANYSDEMKNLSVISKELAEIKLRNALAEQEAGLKANTKAMLEAWDAASKFYDNRSVGVLDNILNKRDMEKGGEAVSKASRGVNLLQKGIKNLGFTSEESKKKGLDQLTSALDMLSTSAAQNTEKGRKLIADMTDLVQKYKEGQITVEQFNKALNGNADVFDRNAESIRDMTQEFVINAVRLQEGERAAFKLGLQFKGLTSEQVESLDSSLLG